MNPQQSPPPPRTISLQQRSHAIPQRPRRASIHLVASRALALSITLLACESESRAATVILADIPADCHTIAIRFSRRAPYHGNLALWKPVVDGRIEVHLGPEFAPHRYGVDAVHIECRDVEGAIVRMMDNTETITISGGEHVIDRDQFKER